VTDGRLDTRDKEFTKLQGQYFAFRRGVCEIESPRSGRSRLSTYFDVTLPSAHNMILTLERRGFIKRTVGRARSIEVLVPLGEIPPLV
jgi:hypothetical protein